MQAQLDETRHVLVGQSPRTRQVLRLIDKLGKCRWPALLLGETGTGKEVVARAIHAMTASKEPFVTIDCSSMVGPLMESELFGHVKGAFTGAANAKMGLIEAANGGTAFFDEIGELPLDLQAKLLRVLQEKEFRPVGSLITRRSDFRIIAATNRDLAKEVEKGNFPPRPLFPAERHQYPFGPAARAQGRHPGADQPFSGPRRREPQHHGRGHGSPAFLRLAGQRSRARKLRAAHGGHQFRSACCIWEICPRTFATTSRRRKRNTSWRRPELSSPCPPDDGADGSPAGSEPTTGMPRPFRRRFKMLPSWSRCWSWSAAPL